MKTLKESQLPLVYIKNIIPASPKRIKLVDTKSFVDVNLSNMCLESDSGTVNIKLKEKSKQFNETMAAAFQYVFLHALNGRRKVNTVNRWINEMNLFTRDYGNLGEIEVITLRMFNEYSQKKGPSQQKLLRSALLYWGKLKVHGITEDLEFYLNTSASPKPRKTLEIQNSVAYERPFKLNEVQRILSVVNELYINKKFNSQANLLWRLIISEALRPSQLSLLKICDIFYLEENKIIESNLSLNVPIVKQSGTSARDLMFKVKLSSATSRAIRSHIQNLQELMGEYPPPSTPLFCLSENEAQILKKSIVIASYIHRTKKYISAAIGDMGDYEFFTRRFKHTKLTHLAILGAPLEILARAGYQTSTVSLRHYTNLTDEAYLKYELQMSDSHDEIFSAFRGKIVEKDKLTKFKIQNRILAPDLSTEIGACAETPCEAFAPVACYTCPRFEAFADGAHKEVLELLLRRQALTAKMGLSGESIIRDAYLISAIKFVIHEISGVKKND